MDIYRSGLMSKRVEGGIEGKADGRVERYDGA